MSFRYTKRIAAAKKKLRKGFACSGCGFAYPRRRALQAHQGAYWPGCPVSFPEDQKLLASVGIFIERPLTF